MQQELITTEQANALSIGDMVTRYACDSSMLLQEEGLRMETYEVKAINKDNQMLSLSMARHTVPIFATAGQIGHIHIKLSDLVADKNWWL